MRNVIRPAWTIRWPLRYSISVLLLQLVLIDGLLACRVEQRLARARIFAEGEQSLIGFGSRQAQALRELLLRGDVVGLRAQVAALVFDRSIISAKLQSTHGAVLASTSRVDIGKQMPVHLTPGAKSSVTVAGEHLRLQAQVRAQALGPDTGALAYLVIERDLSASLQASAQQLRPSFMRDGGYFLAVS